MFEPKPPTTAPIRSAPPHSRGGLAALLFGFAGLVLAAPAQARVDIPSDRVSLTWSPAAGAVEGYGVFVYRNGASKPELPPRLVSARAPRVEVVGVTGDEIVVRVAAFDDDGDFGPLSSPSDRIRLVEAAPEPEPGGGGSGGSGSGGSGGGGSGGSGSGGSGGSDSGGSGSGSGGSGSGGSGSGGSGGSGGGGSGGGASGTSCSATTGLVVDGTEKLKVSGGGSAKGATELTLSLCGDNWLAYQLSGEVWWGPLSRDEGGSEKNRGRKLDFELSPDAIDGLLAELAERASEEAGQPVTLELRKAPKLKAKLNRKRDRLKVKLQLKMWARSEDGRDGSTYKMKGVSSLAPATTRALSR